MTRFTMLTMQQRTRTRFIPIAVLATAIGLPGSGCASSTDTAPASSSPAHLLSEQGLRHLATIDFQADRWPPHLTPPRANHRAEIVPDPDDPDNRVLRITIPRGAHYGASLHFPLRDDAGDEPERALLRYRIRFDGAWRTSSSGKLPGFSGTYGRAGWGGKPSDGFNGWSARGLFSPTTPAEPGDELGRTPIGAYIYHAGIASSRPGWIYGESVSYHARDAAGSGPRPLGHDRWHGIEKSLRLNSVAEDSPDETGGQPDGILRAVINGKLALQRDDLLFRHTRTLRIESVWLDVYHGGKDPAPDDLVLFLDDIEIFVGEPG